MSVKGEAKSATGQTEPTANSLRSSAQHDREQKLKQKVIDTWQDFITADTPSWNKKALRDAEQDPFACTCGPCKRFWKDNFTNISILKEPVLKRAQKTSTMFRPEQKDWRIKVGDRVVVDGKHNGVCRFVGLLDENVIAPSVYVGVHLDENVGSTHNGVMNGTRYFHCERGHGALVPYTDVRRIEPPEPRPEVSGNYMFESYEEVIKTRALRRQKMEADHMNEQKPSVVKPPSRLRKSYTVFDENDVAYKDSQREGGTQVYHYANSTVKVRTGGPPKPKADPQARRFAKWKEEFGGGERGDKLVKTLKKLHEALAKGKELDQEGEEPIEQEDEEYDEEERPGTVHSSKPPTRGGERQTPSRQASPMKMT